MTEILEGQVDMCDLGIWSGKMFQELSAATEEKTSPRLSKRSSKSQSQMPMCMCVRRTNDGQSPGVITLTMEAGALLGAYTMHSFGESPREENASRLSQILEDSPHPKYYLSEKACQGILNRADRRGKALPEQLETALRVQSVSKNEPDAPGGGKEILIQLERTGTLSTLNNQSVFCLQGNGIERPAVAAFSAGQGAKDGGIGYAKECSPSLKADASGTNMTPAVMCLNDPGGSVNSAAKQPLCIEMTSTKNTITDSSVMPTITARMGTGGNQVNAVMAMQGFGDYKESEISSGCKARDYKDAADLVVGFDRAAFNQGVNAQYAPQFYTDGTMATQVARGPAGVCAQNTVRRLTPMECERLQGFPDGWTDIGDWVDSKGKRHKAADSPRYKALGNSIALPFWRWMLKRISAQYERTPTMASLFDGIGGFPYLWEGINGKGSAVWASEIEEFPMAVTKIRLGEG